MDGTQSDARNIAIDASPSRASARLWGLDWSSHLPWQIGEIEVTSGSFEEALPFIREHYEDIFGTRGDDRFLAEEMTSARMTFYREADVFLFRAQGEIVGIHICHPTDWSTYYLRTLATTPRFRGAGFYVDMNQRMEAVLREHGVKRIEVDVSPMNHASNTMCAQRGYVVTGMSNTERWGAMVRHSRFLGEDAENVFRKQFTFGVSPNRRRDRPG